MKQILLVLLFLPLFAEAQIITTIAGNGTRNFSGDGGAASAATFDFPIDVYPTSSGGLYIVDEDNNRLRFMNSSGIITTVAGNGTTAWASEGVPATTVGIWHPRAVCTDASGNIFIADEGNERIRKVTPSGLIYNYAGNGTMAYSGDGGAATDASIYEPWGLCTDPAGNLYIADNMNSVIRKVTPAGIISTYAGNGGTGHTGDGGPATAATFIAPVGICIDESGNMYIADQHTIRKITGGIINTIAGTGTQGYSGDGGAATAATLYDAMGICLDAAGNLFIAENGNSVIRKVTPAGIISTYAGTGTAGFSGDNGPASAAMLYQPTGVHIDAGGNMYIADYGNQRIRKVASSGTGVTPACKTAAIINVYPNPGISKLTITSTTDRITSITIINLLGQTMYTHENNAQEVQVNVADLPKGMYLIRINGSEVRTFVKE